MPVSSAARQDWLKQNFSDQEMRRMLLLLRQAKPEERDRFMSRVDAEVERQVLKAEREAKLYEPLQPYKPPISERTPQEQARMALAPEKGPPLSPETFEKLAGQMYEQPELGRPGAFAKGLVETMTAGYAPTAPELEEAGKQYPGTEFVGELAGFATLFSGLAKYGITVPQSLGLPIRMGIELGAYEAARKPEKGESRAINALVGSTMGLLMGGVGRVAGRAIKDIKIRRAVERMYKENLSEKELLEAQVAAMRGQIHPAQVRAMQQYVESGRFLEDAQKHLSLEDRKLLMPGARFYAPPVRETRPGRLIPPSAAPRALPPAGPGRVIYGEGQVLPQQPRGQREFVRPPSFAPRPPAPGEAPKVELPVEPPKPVVEPAPAKPEAAYSPEEMFAVPLWAERFPGLTKRIRELREYDDITARIKFPEWQELSVVERQELLNRGFTVDVDRMGKPLLGISRGARADVLRARVMGKQKVPIQEPPKPKLEPAPVKPQAPPVAEPTTMKPQAEVIALETKWQKAKVRNSSNAMKDLDDLEKKGFDVQDSKDALQQYKDIERADYESIEDFVDERTAAWDEFLDTIGSVERFQAPPVKPQATPVVTPTTQPYLPTIERVRPTEVAVSAREFQFKTFGEGEVPGGVEFTSGAARSWLKSRKWDPEFAGPVTLWQDTAGKNWVVDGHHRLALAVRDGADWIEARILREVDGVTKEDARLRGALINISGGRGHPIDFGKLFRSEKWAPEDLTTRGISTRQKAVEQGTALAALDEGLFTDVATGKIPLNRGVILGRELPNQPANQRAALEMLTKLSKRKPITDDIAESVIKHIKGAEQFAEGQTTLFGFEEVSRTNALEKAQISARMKSELKKIQRVFRTISKEDQAKMVEAAGNVLQRDVNLQEASIAEVALEVFSKTEHLKGTTVNGIINHHATEMAKAKTQGEKNRHVTEAIRELREAVKGGEFFESIKPRTEGPARPLPAPRRVEARVETEARAPAERPEVPSAKPPVEEVGPIQPTIPTAGPEQPRLITVQPQVPKGQIRPREGAPEFKPSEEQYDLLDKTLEERVTFEKSQQKLFGEVREKPRRSLKELQDEYVKLEERELYGDQSPKTVGRLKELTDEITERLELNPNEDELSSGIGAILPDLRQNASNLMKQAELRRKSGQKIPGISIDQPVRDLGSIAQGLGTPTNQWWRYGSHAQEAADEMWLAWEKYVRETAKYDDETASIFKSLTREYRTKKGRKFIELIDKHSPEEIERMELPAEVKGAGLRYKKLAESQRQQIVRIKRDQAERFYDSLENNTAMAKFVDQNLPGYSYNVKSTGALVFKGPDGKVVSRDVIARELAKIDYPDDWGFKGRWFPHLFVGNYRLSARIGRKEAFIGRATDPNDALRQIAAFHANHPELTVDAYSAENDIFLPPDAVRLTDGRYWRLIDDIKKSSGISKSDIREALSGKIGRKASREKWYGALQHRIGYTGWQQDFMRAMAVNNRGFVRWREMTAMNAKVVPLIERMKSLGQNSLARDAEELLDMTWGRRTPLSLRVDGSLQALSRATGHRLFFKPMALDRFLSSARSLTAMAHLETGRFALMQNLQTFATLWPTVPTKDFMAGLRWMRTPEGLATLQRHGVKRSAIRWSESGILGPRPSKYRISTITEQWNQARAFAIQYWRGVNKLRMNDAQAARYARLRGQLFTQFLPSPSDLPGLLRHPILSQVFMYKRFPIKNIEIGMELLRSKDYPAVSKWFAAQLLFGGVRLFTSPWTYLGAGGYKIYKGWDEIEKKYGKTTRDLFEFGLPGLVGMDLSGSLQMVDIPYGSNLKERLGTVALGPMGGTAYRFVSDLFASKATREEGWYERIKRSTEGSLPLVRQLVALERLMTNDTLFKDPKGRLKYQGTMRDILFELGNFRTTEQTKKMREYIDAMYDVQSERDSAADRIVQKFNSDKHEEAIIEWEAWNRSFPEFVIEGKTIRSRLRRRIEAEQLDQVERRLRAAPEAVENTFRALQEGD